MLRSNYTENRVRQLWSNFMDTGVMTREEFIETVAESIHEPYDTVRGVVDKLYPEAE